MSPSFKTILYEKHGAVAVITMNRPDKLNARNTHMYKELTSLLGELDNDREIRAIVITDAGNKAFSADADMNELDFNNLRESADCIKIDATAFRAIENVRVLKSHLIGEIGDGWKILMDALNIERLGVAAGAIGVSRACMEATADYTIRRVAFNKTLSDIDGVKVMGADMVISARTKTPISTQMPLTKWMGWCFFAPATRPLGCIDQFLTNYGSITTF